MCETLLTASRFRIERRNIRLDDGREAVREFVIHPGAVVILPLFSNQELLMIRQKRFAVGESLLELPAGTLEADENPVDCANRELLEETGYRAGRIEPLTTFYTSPGILSEVMHAFVARELAHVGQNLDETEQIDVEPMTLSKVTELLRTGQLRDAKTIATLSTYFLQERLG